MSEAVQSELEEIGIQEEQAKALTEILRAAKAYSEGDALAGLKLKNLTKEDYKNINIIFKNHGISTDFSNYMSLVGFVTSPETQNERLNNALNEL